ncbi:hypothetical protein [Dyadobacter sp. 676]|uniref:Uncharacterized protein n=1 Tax=Dyadobacter sp. 676 TaxID=3088362 RepID=A0AAU8FGJ5_9BACT
MKRQLLLLASLILAGSSVFAQNGNVGIGTSTPGTKLDVNGAITNRETVLTVSGNAVSVPANTSQVQLTGSATATIAVSAPAAPNAGQRLVIFNNTTGGFEAVLNNFQVPAGQAVEFSYSNGNWWAFKYDVAKPQMLVVEKTASNNMAKGANGTSSLLASDVLKANTIPGASYDESSNAITVPAGTYLVQMVIEGDYAGGDASTTGDGLKPNHSFFYDFPINNAGSKRIHGNTIGNFGGASNFGVTIQYVTTITTPRTFIFQLGWGQGGNVLVGTNYNISTGTQLALTKIL